jgi:hypothetical protein
MAGTIKKMIDTIIAQKARGNSTLIMTTHTKLILKGFNPDKYSDTTPDDPEAVQKLSNIAREMGVQIRPF